MKIIRKSDAVDFKNSEICFGKEYPWDDNDMNGAVIEVRGRYPDKGRVVNEISKELVYVLEGSGKLVLEDKTTEFDKADMLLINPNEKYYWDGNCVILTVCTPAFDPGQHIEVE